MWLKNLFGSLEEEETDAQKDSDLEQKIHEGIRKCEADRQAAYSEIKNLYKYAEDAIMDTYADFFENAKLSYYRDKHRVGLLERYPKIKAEHGSAIGTQMVDQCDKVVNGYLNQASMLESKAKLFDKMLEKYKETLEKLNVAKQKLARMNKLEQHTDRINTMGDGSSHIAASMIDEMDLEEITRDVEMRDEYYNQLDMLNQQYGDDKYFENALNHKSQVDNMLNKI